MATIKIDDKDYDLDKMSNVAKEQLASLQFCDQELQRLHAQAAVLQTARMTYAKSLKEVLEAGGEKQHEKPAIDFGSSGSIKFS